MYQVVSPDESDHSTGDHSVHRVDALSPLRTIGSEPALKRQAHMYT